MRGESGEKSEGELSAWEPLQLLQQVDQVIARYSRGFLRCRPEKWFPGFAMQWMPLAHSLGVELRLVEAKPLIGPPRGLETSFAGSIDDEPIGLFMDGQSTEVLLDAVCPGARPAAQSIVLEYMARRLLSSLSFSWSGPETPMIQFEPDMNPAAMREVGAVKLTATMNGTQMVVWVLIGKQMVERLDSLWRRQLASSNKQAESMTAHVEMAHLTVPPSMLSKYLQRGTRTDLQVPADDTAVLVVDGQPWLPARLCLCGDNFGLEILPGAPPPSKLPEGTNRLSVELGSIELDAAEASELAQAGAIYDTGIAASDNVQITVNGESVAQAILSSVQGRYAVSVL